MEKPIPQTEKWTRKLIEAVRQSVHTDGSFSLGPLQDVLQEAIDQAVAWARENPETQPEDDLDYKEHRKIESTLLDYQKEKGLGSLGLEDLVLVGSALLANVRARLICLERKLGMDRSPSPTPRDESEKEEGAW